MSNYSSLIAQINADIRQNGSGAITGQKLQVILDAMVASLGTNYQFYGVAATGTERPSVDQNIFLLAFDAGTYTNFGATVLAEGEIGIFTFNGTWTYTVKRVLQVVNDLITGGTGKALSAEQGRVLSGQIADLSRVVGETIVSKNITSGATQQIAEVSLMAGDIIRMKLSGSYRAGTIIISGTADFSYQLATISPYNGEATLDLTLAQDISGLWLYMADETHGVLNIDILQNFALAMDNAINLGRQNATEIAEMEEEIGKISISKNLTSGVTQQIAEVSLRNGEQLILKFGGTFTADIITLYGNAACTYQLVTIYPYHGNEQVAVTLTQDISGLWLYMNGEVLGLITIDILQNMSRDIQNLKNDLQSLSGEVAGKYAKPVRGIPASDMSEPVQEALDEIGAPDYSTEYNASDLNGFVMYNGEIVASSSSWKSLTVPLKKGCLYTVSGGAEVYMSENEPAVGMTIAQCPRVYPPYFVADDSQKYMLITRDTDSPTPLVVSVRAEGLSALMELGKTGLALGDSNMQATAITVGEGEDPGTIIGSILRCSLLNGGIGGTTYADVNGLLSFNKLADALVSRDFSGVDAGIAAILQEYPSFTCLTTRWAAIKQTPLADIDFLLLAYGTNDWNLGKTIDNENNPLDVSTILGSLRYGVKKLLEANPSMRIYVVTPAYRYGMNDDDNNDSDNYPINGVYLHEVGDAIFDACKALHIPCLNYYYTSGSNTYNRSAILNGGTHRTKYGYELMGKQYSKFIMSY